MQGVGAHPTAHAAGAHVPAVLRVGGYVAVGFFFVLSGFVLAYAHPWIHRPSAAERRAFFRARFARIYPVFALSLAITLPFYWSWLATGGLSTREVADTVALDAAVKGAGLSAFVPRFALSWSPPTWSISVEAFFYASFPFVAPLVLRAPMRRAATVVLATFALPVALEIAYGVFAPNGWAANQTDVATPFAHLVKFDPLVRWPEFLLGILVAKALRTREARACASRGSWLAMGAVAVPIAVLARSDAIPYMVLHDSLLALPFAFVVYAVASDRGPLSRALSARPLVRLGEASYSLYLLHLPVSWTLERAAAATGAWTAGGSAHVVLVVAASIAAALACHRWFEAPMRRWIVARGEPGRDGLGRLRRPRPPSSSLGAAKSCAATRSSRRSAGRSTP
jgi:peptidoglycan/LPS O-acetylase OafA/YrhL